MTENVQSHALNATLDQNLTPAPGVPEFDSCLIDESASIAEVTIGKDKFRLRSITAGEAAVIWQRSRLSGPSNGNGKEPAGTIANQVDMGVYMTLTVCAALGGLRAKPLGHEGWSFDIPPNELNVGRLTEAAVLVLFREHQQFFRPERWGIEKLGAHAPLEPKSEDG